LKITDLKCAVIASSGDPHHHRQASAGADRDASLRAAAGAAAEGLDRRAGPARRRARHAPSACAAASPFGSAVSISALWDIAGKALNAPVYRLLGGKVRDQVRTYRTLYQKEVPGGADHTPEGYKRWAEYAKTIPGEFTLFKLPTAFHSSMVRDFRTILRRSAPFPYPHTRA
jgi:L-alanine-DL-glutamate epimerase-like enolase superfamily enzyme